MANVNEHWKGTVFGGYKKLIGGERFYFGQSWGILAPSKANEKKAQQIADQFVAYFAALKSQKMSWSAASKESARISIRLRLGLATIETVPALMPTTLAAPVVKAVPTSPTIIQNGLTLAGAIEKYKTAEGERLATKKITRSTYDGNTERIDSAKSAFPSLDIPLTSIGRVEVVGAVNHWIKRPMSDKTKKPIGVASVTHRVGAMGHFFRWAYTNELWEGFRDWESQFKVDESSLMTDDEEKQAEEANAHFTIDELATLYANASGRTRLYMLLGLNCAAGQMEIATLRTRHLQLAQSPARIERVRNKTKRKAKVLAQWELWDETTTALRAYTSPYGDWGAEPTYKRQNLFQDNHGDKIDDPQTLALKSEDGFPLIHGSTDVVQLAWQRLNKSKVIKDSGIRRLGFYSLRKTAAQMIKDIAGYETHIVFGAWATMEKSGRKSVSEKHYTTRSQADFDKVAIALRAYRVQLEPMFKAAMAMDAAKVKST